MSKKKETFEVEFDELCGNVKRLINLLQEKNTRGEIYDIIPENKQLDILESIDAVNSSVTAGSKILTSPIYRMIVKGVKGKLKKFFKDLNEEEEEDD